MELIGLVGCEERSLFLLLFCGFVSQQLFDGLPE